MGQVSTQLQTRIRARTPRRALAVTGIQAHMLQRKCPCGGSPGVDGECAECRAKRLSMKHRATDTASSSHSIPPIVHKVLNSPGQPLDVGTRAFMEPRFGHDFSAVHVHTDARAAESARAVNALAYTVGRDVVFEAGHYAPGTNEGRTLLAHELTHVVQQRNQSTIPGTGLVVSSINSPLEREAERGANAAAYHSESDFIERGIQQSTSQKMIQRQPKTSGGSPKTTTPADRRDVVLFISKGLQAEAITLAPKGELIQVKSIDDMASKLKSIKFPIKTLFIISHSLPSGDLGFEDGTYVLPKDVASKLKGTLAPENAPQTLDFRGCSIGINPKAMNEIRAAVGANAAIGGNCFMLQLVQGPVTLDRIKITKPTQVNRENRKDFEIGFKKLIDSFKEARDCILDKSEEAYFRAGGKLVAEWFSPNPFSDWDKESSVCYTKLTPEKVDPSKMGKIDPLNVDHCRLIRVEKQ